MREKYDLAEKYKNYEFIHYDRIRFQVLDLISTHLALVRKSARFY